MDSTELLTPIIAGGIRNSHFFNGRLLTAEDLRVEQDANRWQHQQLGQAIGTGVVHGMDVQLVADGSSGTTPTVAVTAGLALNGLGQALALPADVEVTLVQQSQTIATGAGLFAVCEPPTATAVPTGTGVYILVVSPASGFEERAPMHGFGTEGQIAGCGSRYAVEGVQFRLVRLEVTTLAGISETTRQRIATLMTQSDPASRAQLRNILAHLCFGSEELAAFPRGPFAQIDGVSRYVQYGALDQLRDQHVLSACDVPLALLFWTIGGVQFVDNWSVRRRPVQPLVGVTWPLHVGQRRLAEAEATFLQFQAQLQTLRAQETNPSSITAMRYFRYLPAAGYLPIGVAAFSGASFFEGLDVERLQVDTAFLRLLVHQSWFLDPIDLTDPPPIRVYAPSANPDYLLFVRGERDQAVPGTPLPGTEPEPGTTPRTGQINVDVDITSAGQATPTPDVQIEADVGIRVWAEDALGNVHPGKFVHTGSQPTFGQGGTIFFRQGQARFVIASLPAGPYTVKARMIGFKEASRKVGVRAGEITTVLFRLVPTTKEPGDKTDKPTRDIVGTWIEPEWFGKIAIIDEYINWPWPPSEWPYQDPIVDPRPPMVNDWLQQWVDWFRDRYPEAPVDPGDIDLYINPSHTPHSIASEPYAYVRFGDTYAPVVLVPTDLTLDLPVSIGKGGLEGVDRDVEGKLQSAGLGELDVLAAGWTGLVADVLGVSVEAASGLVTNARDQAEEIQVQGGLLIFDGMSADLQAALKRLGSNDAVDLANADPQALADADIGITLSFAQRLVERARQVVPRSAWSLDGLGLKEDEITTLRKYGITTQGTLQTQVANADEEVKAQIAADLGTSTEAVDALIARASASKTTALNRRKAAAPVTRIFGVNQETASALARQGIGTVRTLADANVDLVVSAFQGDAASAAAAIEAAQAEIA